MSDTTQHNTPAGPTLLLWRLVLAVYWVLLALATHWPSLSVVETPPRAPDDPWLLLQHDKPIHLLAFGGLALLLIRARPLGRSVGDVRNKVVACAIALGYAVLDETTQGLSADRTVSHSDLLANVLGILGVLLLSLTPRRDLLAQPGTDGRALRRLALGLGALLVSGAVLAMARYVARETWAFHFVAAAGVALAVLRGGPILPRRPRMSTLAVVGGVCVCVAGGEIAQGFAGLPFSRNEVFFGMTGLALAMALWSARAALHAGTARRAGEIAYADGDAEPAPTDPPSRA